METLGQFLRKEREVRGVSLEHLSGLTRINSNVLRRIESDDFRTAPQQVYLKGFLKSYASQLGLDPRDILSRYEGLAEAPRPEAPAPASSQEEGLSGRILWLSVFLAVAAATALAVYFLRR